MKHQRALWASTSMTTKGGIATVVRTMRDTPLWEEWDIHHVATHRDGSIAARAATFVVGFAKFLTELVFRRPDVVHVHMASGGSFVRKCVLMWLATVFRVPVVIQLHGGGFGQFYTGSSQLVQTLIRATLSRASAVVALGTTWAGQLREISPGASVSVIANPIRIGDQVRQPGIDEPINVVFLGLVADSKGTFTLIDAWAKVLQDTGIGHQKLRLTIAGDGELDRARASIAAHGIGDSVDVPGWIAPSDIPEILANAQILVLPSRMEAQPMAILEAMARGLCVVASSVGGIPDLIDDTCGILISPDDVDGLAAALSKVVEDSEIRSALGSAALARARAEFDVETVWRRFDEVYRQVVN